MMQFQLSRTLAKDLLMHVQASMDLSPSALQWYGHSMVIDQRKCVIMMEAQSRYAMVFCGMEKRDFEDFPGLFQQRLLREVSIIAQLEAPLTEADLALLSDLVLDISAEEIFHPGSNRSVTSHLNQVRHHLEILLEDDFSLPATADEAFQFGLIANDAPRMRQGSKEYFYPLRIFHEFWLGLLNCAKNANDRESQASSSASTGKVIWGRFGKS